MQTSGCTVRIKPIGVAEGDGGGTTAYSTDGIVLYTPTQAETNYTSFILIAKKTGCIPVSVTVVTTSSVTPGTVLLAPVTHTSATIPTVTTTTTATNVTTVNGLAAGVITAASIATGAIDADALATDAVTEIQSGLATPTNITAGTITTTTNLTNLPAITANWLTAAGTAADFGAEIATALWTDTTAGDFTVALSVGKSVMNGVTLGTGLTINAYTGNTAQTADVATLITTVGAAGAGLTDLGGMSTMMKAQVESEVNDALIAKGLDHLVFTSVTGTDIADNSIIARIAASGATADWDTFVQTTDSLQAIRDRGDAAWTTGAGGGAGARTVAITVNDGVTALQNAYVRVTNGAETYVLQTSVAGLATFSLDDATWSVAITKPLYSFTPTTLVVNGDETQTYSMSAVSIPASSPGLVTGYLYCLDNEGVARANVTVTIRQTSIPDAYGYAFDQRLRAEVSDGAGLVSFDGMFPGAAYSCQSGPSPKTYFQFVIPSGASDPFEMPSVIGN